MYAKYKILILPIFVLLLAGSTLFCNKSDDFAITSFSKASKFPFKQVPKTEWTKQEWSNKVYKTFTSFICPLEKNKIERPKVFTIINIEKQSLFTFDSFYKYIGRAPPIFS